MLILTLIGLAVVALAHTAPAPFVLDAMAGNRAVWHMPRGVPSTVYLTYDNGPNPTTTPDLLDVLAREQIRVTFFLIDRHITDETASIRTVVTRAKEAVRRARKTVSRGASRF